MTATLNGNGTGLDVLEAVLDTPDMIHDMDVYGDLEPMLEPVTGIWDDTEIFTKYRVGLKFTDRVMGGVPQNGDAIEGWIRKSLTTGNAEMVRIMRETLEDLEIDTTGMNDIEQLKEAAKRYAATQHGNTFRRDENGLFLRDYQIKAMIKEATNILFAGVRWGATRKGPRNFVAERVFVDESRIYLGRTKPDGTHLQVGHVTGPKGPRSTLTLYDYAVQPEIRFTVSSLNDEVTAHQWRHIFLAGQREGLGAIRSLGYGQFRVTDFTKL